MAYAVCSCSSGSGHTIVVAVAASEALVGSYATERLFPFLWRKGRLQPRSKKSPHDAFGADQRRLPAKLKLVPRPCMLGRLMRKNKDGGRERET
jgi:hypothetical protein